MWVYLILLVIGLMGVSGLCGWWFARHWQANKFSEKRRLIGEDYLKGLNYILSEQPDKGLEIFLKIFEANNDTIDTHFALGHLFRRRGEVARAIQIHQNLIARPNLSRQQHATAILELGVDYLKSGWFDRAEGLFKELSRSGFHAISADKGLLEIYQQEKDWDNAILVARSLQANTNEPMGQIIAQFYCEKATQFLQHGDMSQAKLLLRRALSFDQDCARASLLKAQISLDKKKYRQALQALHHVEQQAPDYLSEALPQMLVCYRQLKKLPVFVDYLYKVSHQYGTIKAVLLLSELLAEQEGQAAAIHYLLTESKKHPSIEGIHQLMIYTIDKIEEVEHDQLAMIGDLTSQLYSIQPDYHCRLCGFDAKSLYWQCPGCKSWASLKPIQNEHETHH